MMAIRLSNQRVGTVSFRLKEVFVQAGMKLDKTAAGISIAFISLLLVTEWLLFRTYYHSYLNYILRGNWKFLLLGGAMILLPLTWVGIWVYSSLLSEHKYKFFYFFLLVIPIFIEYSFQHTLARFSQSTDFELYFKTTAGNKLTAVQAFINWYAIFPCMLYFLAITGYRSIRKNSGLAGAAISITLLISINVAIWSILPKLQGFQSPTIAVAGFYRSLISFSLNAARQYNGPREKVEISDQARLSLPSNNVVFIIDESIKGDHLSLNGYERKTTPYLDELLAQKKLHNWGIAAAGTTCSVPSDNLLVVGLQPTELPDLDQKIRKRPSIFQYAKAMGYKTYLLDGQMTSFWLGAPHDMEFIDEWRNEKHFADLTGNAWEIDFVVAKTVNDIISKSKGNFFFIVKRGNHFPYLTNMPSANSAWTPLYEGKAIDHDKIPALINTYDSVLRYNVNGFFERLIPGSFIPNNTVIVYTSDHGQTLGENKAYNTHCGVSRNEAIVPLFIIGDLPKAVDVSYKPSHANIFSTLLDLMSVPASAKKYDYAKSLLKASGSESVARYYWGMDLSSGSRQSFD